MSDIEYSFKAIVRVITEPPKTNHVSLRSCEIVEFEVVDNSDIPEHYEFDITSWAYPSGIIATLYGKGFKNGLFGIEGTVTIDYHTDYWGEVDEDIEYPKFEVTELVDE